MGEGLLLVLDGLHAASVCGESGCLGIPPTRQTPQIVGEDRRGVHERVSRTSGPHLPGGFRHSLTDTVLRRPNRDRLHGPLQRGGTDTPWVTSPWISRVDRHWTPRARRSSVSANAAVARCGYSPAAVAASATATQLARCPTLNAETTCVTSPSPSVSKSRGGNVHAMASTAETTRPAIPARATASVTRSAILPAYETVRAGCSPPFGGQARPKRPSRDHPRRHNPT